MRQASRSPEIFIAGLYSLAFVLALTPYYNWFYRVAVNFLHFFSFWICLVLIALLTIHLYIHRRRFGKLLLAISLGLLIFLAGSQVHKLRYSITNVYIRNSICKTDSSEADGLILGGIRPIEIEGLPPPGAFENDSHCLSPAGCAEEFYYCEDASVTIGP